MVAYRTGHLQNCRVGFLWLKSAIEPKGNNGYSQFREPHMSTVKNPEEKKLLSLKHDRRNTYGENAKANIARIVIAASMTFWFLRKMEKGLAISDSLSEADAPPAEDDLTARACDDYPNIAGFAGAT